MQSGTRHTEIGEAKPAFTAVIKEGQLLLNMSYAIVDVDDGNGNKITFRLWINGDWNVDYKGKEYIIPMNDNINAFIEWINSQENS